jgi:hypothetical protein
MPRSDDLLRIDIDDGKYTIIQDSSGVTKFLRYGEPWIDSSIPGINMVLAMAYELEELRQMKNRLMDDGK